VVASQYKVTAHQQRITDYLAGKPVFPITLELDLTSRCNRSCQDCPSARAADADILQQKFIETLLDRLAGRTPGLLLTGGEPTMAPLFAWSLKTARQKDFKEIAVVTNGSRLDEPEVYPALLENASTIRLSLYDFKNSSCEGIEQSLARIKRLRKKIDASGSELKIGISTLTSTHRIPVLKKITAAVQQAGAHWLYFHPMCWNWGKGAPVMIDQTGVIDVVQDLQQTYLDTLDIYYAPERYSNKKVAFKGYHGAHFLMIVGADGKNYLGAEVKYQPDFVVADLNLDLEDNFLWHPRRLANIASIRSNKYRAIQSRHRGALYSALIQKLKDGDISREAITRSDLRFRFPAVL
jgi:hypothetical protein